MSKKETIIVQGTEIAVVQIGASDYISLTDMAHSRMEEHIIIYIGTSSPHGILCRSAHRRCFSWNTAGVSVRIPSVFQPVHRRYISYEVEKA
jgi:hypothetical protein